MSAEIRAKKTYVKDNEDGTPYFDYDFTNVLNPDTHAAVLTGPIQGVVTMDDGTQYNATDFAIGVQLEHLDEFHTKVITAHIAAGTFPDVVAPNPAGPYEGAILASASANDDDESDETETSEPDEQ